MSCNSAVQISIVVVVVVVVHVPQNSENGNYTCTQYSEDSQIVVCFLSCLDMGIPELNDTINKVVTQSQRELMEVNDKSLL